MACRKWLVAFALVLTIPASAYATSPLEDQTYFAQLAKNGFGLTVNGSFFADPATKSGFPNLVSNIGSPANSYAWSMSWFNNRLYVGTVRNIHCAFTPLPEGCPADGIPDSTYRAEIWRYTPSANTDAGDWGYSGNWQRIFQSPYISALISLFGGLPSTTPRDIGYRNMVACNAGDQVERLYVATFGIPGNILYSRGGSSFTATSSSGTYTTLASLISGDFDLGYRGLVCFKGRLWTSPAGTLTDPDASAHPVLLMNPRPATSSSAWQQVLNVSSGHALSDPGNGGIFDMAAIGNYLFVAVGNRTTGFELWRGDGTNCLPPWQGSSCTLSWTKLIDNGAGRPDDQSTQNPGIDNAGATLGVYESDLYMGVAESGFFGLTTAELLRIPNAGLGGTTWQLLVGWPRQDYTTPEAQAYLGTNFDCLNPGDIEGGSNFFLSDPDTDEDDCLPASGHGPGMGTPSDSSEPSPYNTGSEAYFWRYQEHEGTFFIGTANLNGADIWRTDDGISYKRVFAGGGWNVNNVGIRSFASTPFGLAVGTANPFAVSALGHDSVDAQGNPAGGAEIFVGSTAFFPGDVSPVARARAEQALTYDTDRDGLVTVTLSDDGSYDPFGGPGIILYEWYEGNRVSSCASLEAPAGVGMSFDAIVTSKDGANDVVEHTYTLRVTSESDKTGCAAVTFTASYNLPSTVDVTPPVITLTGANPQILTVGDNYTELGATASDDHDGDISGSILIDASAVDTSVAGNYTVTYNVQDSARNPATEVTRTVKVQAVAPLDVTGPQVSITFPVSGVRYNLLSFASGCGTSRNDICGTVSDDISGVANVDVAIASSSLFRNRQLVWHTAEGGANWGTALADWAYAYNPAPGTYVLYVRATDNAGNQVTKQTTFSFGWLF